MRLPGVVHQGERGILAGIDSHLVFSESSVCSEPFCIFPSRNGSGAASYSLEIGVRNPSDGLDGGKHGSSHSVSSGNVLCASLGHEPRVLAYLFAEGNGIVIICT